MRRRRAASTIASRVLRGRGQGAGAGYLPGLDRREVPSQGRSAHLSLFGRTRHHCTLSGLERRVAVLLGWDDDILDIREQYPLLPVSLTQELAIARGIRHPARDGHPLERTLDFRVEHRRHGWLALSVKPVARLDGRAAKSERSAKRKRDLLELERAFAEAMGWPWALVVEDDVPLVRSRNLDVLRERWSLRLHGLDSTDVEDIAVMVARHLGRGACLAEACSSTDAALKLPSEGGTSLAVSLHFLARKRWSVDLDSPFDPRLSRPTTSPPADTGWVCGLHFLGADR